ncbi:GntR family transcriptional regulator [Sinorhizobium saheli]|uniref:Transcriptional regulator n=1 Tax=Sinorhizobium saheli TaxID=36856 RepID=A0A178YSE8_SINSA|nr:GntR family transcriptional regulator [Sinorhizobium saheli]MQW89603.1 FCD domain-containing protein [Sinorhizobium saheli]OAP50211.1 transcriptional regulator [Sinorhizobium saheli]
MDRTKLPKIEKMPADVRALGVLRARIIEGAIPAGARLTEVQISDEMGLSRATVRTALHQLAQEGLVSLVPYTGWTVVKLSQQDIWELYTLRAAVERLAAGLAATNGAADRIADIRKAFHALEVACERKGANEIAEADFGFHKSIVDASGHSRLCAQYGLIEHQIRVYIRSSDALIADPSEILDQHRPILDAILAKDSALAAELSEEHNLREGQKLTASVSGL